MFSKMLFEDSVEGREVAWIFKPYAAAYDVFWSVARFVENREEVANCLTGLRNDVACNHLSIDHGNLARNVKPAIGFDCPCKGKVLTARSFAAFHSIPLDAHSMLHL